MEQDSVVTVTISKGPHLVPDVVGLNRSDAIKQIVDLGFQYDIRGDDRSTEVKGTVTPACRPVVSRSRRGRRSPCSCRRTSRRPRRRPTTPTIAADSHRDPDRGHDAADAAR